MDSQSFHTRDKLSLQNNFSDATSMKDYLSYRLFGRMEVDAPATSYVWLTVDGEDQGLFPALEKVEGRFPARTADGKGTIYKPENGDPPLNDEEMKRITAG